MFLMSSPAEPVLRRGTRTSAEKKIERTKDKFQTWPSMGDMWPKLWHWPRPGYKQWLRPTVCILLLQLGDRSAIHNPCSVCDNSGLLCLFLGPALAERAHNRPGSRNSTAPLPLSDCWSCEFPSLVWGYNVYSYWGLCFGPSRITDINAFVQKKISFLILLSLLNNAWHVKM